MPIKDPVRREAWFKAWRAENADRLRADERARVRDKAKLRAYQAAWRERHREHLRDIYFAYGKLWRERNKERVNAMARARRDDVRREKERRWAADYKERRLKADTYIRQLLRKQTGLPDTKIPSELIDAKKAHLKLKRLLKEMK